jgi:hypothetical protein
MYLSKEHETMMTDQQVNLLRTLMSKTGNLQQSAAKAGICRQTASKYIREEKLPSELKQARTWKTHPDIFSDVWSDIEIFLKLEPEIETKTLFEDLQEQYPEKFEEKHLRTLYRRVNHWRALHSDLADYEVFFPQVHRAGEAAQTDFTHTKELGVTLSGVAFAPLLCHFVLPYSSWEWASCCQSESFLALKKGIQAAIYELGYYPEWHQTDNSTGATHRVSRGGRALNQDYIDFMAHIGMKPRTTGVGKKEQNGSVESLNGAFKRFLKQQLIRRGSRDFDSKEQFNQWLQVCLIKRNKLRKTKLNEELQQMSVLTAKRLPEFKSIVAKVSRNSTVNVLNNIYSVPPRVMRKELTIRIYEDHLQVYYQQIEIQAMPRLIGVSQHDVNYRHVIWSLVKKSNAFSRYSYRESLFINLTFRQAYEQLENKKAGIWADKQYLQILYLAATTFEHDVQMALELLIESKLTPTFDAVKNLLAPHQPELPKIDLPEVNLADYDQLIQGVINEC